jgi:RimJ/RimL family protein N-acetyltransferase
VLRNWPLSSLVVTSPRLTLRWPTLADLDALADRGAEGVHDPSFMPFFSQWTDGEPATIAQRVLQRHWTALGAWTPQDWTLYLAVVHEGTVVGSQSIGARNFASTREVLVTAWLGRRFQGQGFGTEARAAMLELAFSGLGAQSALSVVRQGNRPSQGVSRRLGFENDGVQVNTVRGQRVLSDRFRLDRETWLERRAMPVRISGLELDGALPLFGLSEVVPMPALSGLKPPLASVLSGIHFDEEGDAVAH